MAVEGLKAAFAAAPLEADGWDDALKRFADASGARGTQLIGFGARGGLHFSRVVNVPELEAIDQISAGVADPGQSWRIASTTGLLQIASERDHDRVRPMLRSAAYDEFCDRLDIPFGAQAFLLREEGLTVGLATLRGRRDGRSTAAQLALFEQVVPYVRTAARLQHALDSQGAELTLGALGLMTAAAFLLDERGMVISQTEAALAAARAGLLRISQARLSVPRSDLDRLLQHAIAVALSGADVPPARFWLPGPDVATGGFCEVFPLPRRHWDFAQRPRIAVIVKPVRRIELARAGELRAALGLTPAEAEIALHLANGATREQIARLRGSSPGTVAIQLKSILQKAGAHREAELVALVNMLLRG